MTNKEKYRTLCETEKTIPLFMQYWWMEATCAGKQWDVLLYIDKNEKAIAALPYLWGSKLGLKYIIHPQETQLNGIWTLPTIEEELRERIYDDFINQLNAMKLAYYYQQYPLESMAPTYMAQHGFKIKTRYTYRIEELRDLDRVINGFSKNKKRQLQKAFSLHADLSMTMDEFYNFHVACLAEKKKEISYSREFFKNLYQAAIEREQAQIIAIRNADDITMAALFLVWDRQSAYFLIPCYSSAYKDSGSGALLVLEAIKFARQLVNVFDFEGSMIKGVANSYRQFGGIRREYYSVARYYKPVFRLFLAINWFRTRKKR